MAARRVNETWQASMAPFFERLEGRRPDEGMLRLEEVFHLE
jgi:L-rhamnose mutarotase